MDSFDNPKSVSPNAEPRIPTHLFKYRSLSWNRSYVRDLVEKQRLYFPGPEELNDPLDCRPFLKPSGTADEMRRRVRAFVDATSSHLPREKRLLAASKLNKSPKRFAKAMEVAFNDSIKDLGIYSLSKQQDQLLMWSHCADEHRGICVRVNVKGLLADSRANIPLRVEYEQRRPIVDPTLSTNLDELSKALLTKADPWRYEEEWRLLRHKDARQIVAVTENVIDGVILGARIKGSDRKDVLSWVSESGRHIEVFQAKFHERDYRLEFEPVTSCAKTSS